MVSAKKRIEGMPKSVPEYQGGPSNKVGTEKSSWRHAKQKSKSSAVSEEEPEIPRVDIRSIFKDIESSLVPSYMTWKDKKNLENKKVVSLGGKPPKKQRLPLSVARPAMKNQKDREEKLLAERAMLGRFGGYSSSSIAKKPDQGRRPEERILRSTVGVFRNGILDVNPMLHAAASSSQARGDSTGHAMKEGRSNRSTKGHGKRKGGGKGKKGGGKGKGGGRKRR